MKKNSIILILSMVGMVLLSSCGAMKSDTANKHFNNKISESNLDNIYDVILTNATREFIGGYPVDESFLAWISTTYGIDALEKIASNGDFANADSWYAVIGKSIHTLWYEYSRDFSFFLNQDVYELETAADDKVTFEFTGDINLADDSATAIKMESSENGILDCFSAGLVEEMKSADLMVVNNEFCYSTRGTPIPDKAFTFRANPDKAAHLLELGVDLVQLANNHVCDFGEDAIYDTFDTLDSINMPYVGAGRNLSEAMRPKYYIANGRKIAIVSATQIERSYTFTKEATETTPGVLKTLDASKFCYEISQAKKNADIVIAIVHWGTEGMPNYDGTQVNLANRFVEAGADVIIGGHTHTLQAIEYVEDVPTFYSLGNYWFATTANMPAPYNTGIAKIEINSDGSIVPSFVPCRFDEGVTSILSGDDKMGAIWYMNSLSGTAVLSDNGNLSKINIGGNNNE